MPDPPADPGAGAQDLITNVIAPILGTGLVGALFLMVLFRVKIMPTYVHDEAKRGWEEERTRIKEASDAEIARLTAEGVELKQALRDANRVYTEQVIPTLTRVLDAERELVDLRRDEAAERRRRGAITEP